MFNKADVTSLCIFILAESTEDVYYNNPLAVSVSRQVYIHTAFIYISILYITSQRKHSYTS